jgi:hypothetical protein
MYGDLSLRCTWQNQEVDEGSEVGIVAGILGRLATNDGREDRWKRLRFCRDDTSTELLVSRVKIEWYIL